MLKMADCYACTTIHRTKTHCSCLRHTCISGATLDTRTAVQENAMLAATFRRFHPVTELEMRALSAASTPEQLRQYVRGLAGVTDLGRGCCCPILGSVVPMSPSTPPGTCSAAGCCAPLRGQPVNVTTHLSRSTVSHVLTRGPSHLKLPPNWPGPFFKGPTRTQAPMHRKKRG